MKTETKHVNSTIVDNANSESSTTFWDNFYDKYKDSKKIVAYTDIKDKIGYKNKQTIEDILSSDKYDFIVDKDYYINKIKKDGICKPINEIYMTVETIECLCMMSSTKEGQDFRRYFMKKKKSLINDVSNEITEDPKVTENSKNDLKENSNIDGTSKFDINKYRGKDVFYLIRIVDNIYKYGITNDICKRLRSHAYTLKYERVIQCWDAGNRNISVKIEECIKKYMRINRLSITYQGQTEIFKTDDVVPILGVFDTYVKKYTKEWNDLFVTAKMNQVREIVQMRKELVDTYERVKARFPDNAIDKLFAGIEDELDLLPKEDKEEFLELQKRIENPEEYSSEDDEDFADPMEEGLVGQSYCKKCKAHKDNDQFGIDPKTDQQRKQCLECNDMDRRVDAKRRGNQILERSDDFSDDNNSEPNESSSDLSSEESNSVDEIEPKIFQAFSFCTRCGQTKKNTEFGIDPKTWKPFKQCHHCREINRAKDKRRSQSETRKEYNKKNQPKYQKKQYEKKKKEKLNKITYQTNLAPTEPQKTLSEKHKEYYAQNKIDIIDHKKKMREKNKQDNTDPTTQFCSKCSQRRSLENFSTNPRTQALYKQCDKCRAY